MVITKCYHGESMVITQCSRHFEGEIRLHMSRREENVCRSWQYINNMQRTFESVVNALIIFLRSLSYFSVATLQQHIAMASS